MDRTREVNAGKRATCVTIRHIGAWDEDRHTEAFLRPIVAGVRRRLATAARKNAPPSAGK